MTEVQPRILLALISQISLPGLNGCWSIEYRSDKGAISNLTSIEFIALLLLAYNC